MSAVTATIRLTIGWLYRFGDTGDTCLYNIYKHENYFLPSLKGTIN